MKCTFLIVGIPSNFGGRLISVTSMWVRRRRRGGVSGFETTIHVLCWDWSESWTSPFSLSVRSIVVPLSAHTHHTHITHTSHAHHTPNITRTTPIKKRRREDLSNYEIQNANVEHIPASLFQMVILRIFLRNNKSSGWTSQNWAHRRAWFVVVVNSALSGRTKCVAQSRTGIVTNFSSFSSAFASSSSVPSLSSTSVPVRSFKSYLSPRSLSSTQVGRMYPNVETRISNRK